MGLKKTFNWIGKGNIIILNKTAPNLFFCKNQLNNFNLWEWSLMHIFQELYSFTSLILKEITMHPLLEEQSVITHLKTKSHLINTHLHSGASSVTCCCFCCCCSCCFCCFLSGLQTNWLKLNALSAINTFLSLWIYPLKWHKIRCMWKQAPATWPLVETYELSWQNIDIRKASDSDGSALTYTLCPMKIMNNPPLSFVRSTET